MLRDEDILKEDSEGKPVLGGSLSVFCDNCGGQNKNNTVLRMAAFLVEMGYFTEVEVVFLIVGHTKNACDRLFNMLKCEYRKENVWSFSQLLPLLNKSNQVKVQQVNHGDFKDWKTVLDQHYNKIKGIQKYHIFHVDQSCIKTDKKGRKQVVMRCKESNLSDAVKDDQQLKKKGALNHNLPEEKDLDLDGLPNKNPMKTVLFHDRWTSFFPAEHREEMCPEPTEEELKAAKSGKKVVGKSSTDKKRKLDELEVQALSLNKKEVTDSVDDPWGDDASVAFESDDDDSDEDSIDVVCLASLARMKENMKRKKAGSDVDGADEESSDDDDENVVLAKLKRRIV